jgi:hypothetical protein
MPHSLSTWIRGLALVGISALGLVAIVGSGGGALGFPPCEGQYCSSGPAPPPAASASIRPAILTALVGTPATFEVETANINGTLSYQWRRSGDAGATFNDIPGATGPTYSLANVNLADDGAVFQVVVRSNGIEKVRATSRLAVSVTPGVVFEDGEFLPADWLVSPVIDAGHAAFVHIEERLTAGGNPGAFRKMTFQLAPGAGSERVFYIALAAAYDPASLGAIRVIDYAEECIALQTSDTTYTESSLVIEQGGRRYLSDDAFHTCVLNTWSPVASRSGLTAQDFRLFDGPACNAGESCPDFSASAPPLRFGYWRISFGTPGDSIAHGIDNWKVTVWRR